jgi:hypothetical protein
MLLLGEPKPMPKTLDEYSAAYAFEAEGKQWVGVVIKNKVVVTVGIEFSEADIIKWCEASLDLWPITGKEAPDAFDRRQ